MFQFTTKFAVGFLVPALLASPVSVRGENAQDEVFSPHFQSTYIWQAKPSFSAPYSSQFSLKPEREKAYSFSATAAFGWRPWRGGELYFDPELVQGVPLSGLAGLGGMVNGEQQKTSGPNPTLYRARLFLRQTWNLGGEAEAIEPDANRLGGTVERRRVVVTVGNLAVTDVFDNSAFAHDARTQFMNWALVAHGAYDFAADARGYSWGATVEYFHDDWTVRMGRFMQPEESNGLPLDRRILKHYGDQVEVEHTHSIGEQQGKIRVLTFCNRANMGGFHDALADAAKTGSIPDVAQVRTERQKHGFGVSAEQAITDDLGIFGRASWNDGTSETYAFTEIERSLSFGAVLKGGRWNRKDDGLGFAVVSNGLSTVHRAYLAAGGHGAFIGDGQLNYRPERILEAYYSASLGKNIWATLDIQGISNPAYNADRGPVRVGSIRLHTQF